MRAIFMQGRKEEQNDMALMDLQAILQQLVTPLGVRIVSLSWTEFNGNRVLELLIDHDDGVDVDLCANVSELLVPTVDQYMIEEENFYFEVASMGAEQPIKTLDMLSEAIGAWVQLELHSGIDGRTIYDGTLVAVNGSDVTLLYYDKTKEKTLNTTWDNIQSARYAVKV